MTVAELTAQLSRLDPALRVIMPDEDDLWCEVAEALEDLVWFDGASVQISDERDHEAVRVVRLFGPPH